MSASPKAELCPAQPATRRISAELRRTPAARGFAGSTRPELRRRVSWTRWVLTDGNSYARVAIIAGAHHERLNGTGYPNRWRAEEIPLQSKMMTISDIFDALTASDRPYKRAVPVDKALHILDLEVKDGHVDTELVRIFRDAKVWEQIMGALY